MVSPVRPTRARAPGGSFICPKTSDVLSMTPDSFISSQRLFPSRVRSPTPANTEKPPCSVAMLRISSMTMTVLPTPAPPKRPILLPLAKVQTRSMTLMPVSRIVVAVSCSLTGGGRRWIGSRPSLLIGPLPSIGSPMTFIIRPRVPFPTGTMMGAPVSFTSVPRTRPSVVAMAIVRTTLLPRCCCTSRTRRPPSRSISSAWLISGSSPASNATSTTGPMIWVTRPTLPFFDRSSFGLAFSATAILYASCYPAASASAPPTISISSFVIVACRTLLRSSVRSLISSPALSVALRIAIICAL